MKTKYEYTYARANVTLYICFFFVCINYASNVSYDVISTIDEHDRRRTIDAIDTIERDRRNMIP